jgi:UTP--glucose-1-phosphate uridylyltransferase
MKSVRKAIIPAAGMGTRFLPATKTVPKEMLTIVDAPIILYVVEEAIQAGIEDIILIQGRGKTAIEDFFDTSYELEDKLLKDGKNQLLERVRKIRDMANIVSVRQKQPLGLGHAVLCAKSIIGEESFAVLLGDEIMINQPQQKNTLSVLVDHHASQGGSVVAVMEVPDSEVQKYGMAEVTDKLSPGLFKVSGFVEKPRPNETRSRWALPGRYVFESEIFTHLQNGKPGALGEIQLTDSMNALCKKRAFLASTFTADRYDAGDKLGYLKANVELALKNAELSADFADYLREISHRLLQTQGAPSSVRSRKVSL